MPPRLAHSHLFTHPHAGADDNVTHREPDAHASSEPRAYGHRDGHARRQGYTERHIHIDVGTFPYTDDLTAAGPDQHSNGNRNTLRDENPNPHGDPDRNADADGNTDSAAAHQHAHSHNHGHTDTD